VRGKIFLKQHIFSSFYRYVFGGYFMSKTLGLALGGGGARGVAHIGFLQALEEEGIRPDYIAGTSMGSVVGACYAKGMDAQTMKRLVFELGIFDLLDVGASPIAKLGILGSKKLKKKLEETLGDITFDDLNIPFQCTSSDIVSGKLVLFQSGKVATAVQASSSIPGLFRPVKFEDKLLVDGGVLCRVPVKQVKEMGADVVIGVDVLYNTSQPIERPNNLISMLLRVFDMMDNTASQFARESYKEMCDLYLEPPIQGYSQYNMKDFDVPFNEGYQMGKDNLSKIQQLLKEDV
jgi:NTE family protein